MSEFTIADRRVGDGCPCYVIAEGCVNHNGSLATAFDLVEAASAAGADAIKFQLHYPEHEMLDDVPASENFAKPLRQILGETHLTESEHAQLADRCRELGIQYLCTAYCREAADVLADLGVPMFKIGSGETLNFPLLRWIARRGRPMLVATGMTELAEVDEMVGVMRGTGVSFGLMHCTSEYPPVYEDINLGMIPAYKARYKVPIGHSDHTPSIWTALGAVALGANLVEKHFTLTRDQPGPDHPVSIEPDELRDLVVGIRAIEVAGGSHKALFDREIPIRAWAHHSVVTLRPVTAGETFSLDSLWVKRPGTGIRAADLETILGKTAARDVAAGVLLSRDDIA